MIYIVCEVSGILMLQTVNENGLQPCNGALENVNN